jgi:pimeloyl-ACP methyl ester carboxylesterase
MMTAHSHETAPTQYVESGGIPFAYRRFGKGGSVPLVFLQYFSANMDAWDPAVTNGFAALREVILFDNAGVGGSGGETPASVSEMTRDCVTFLDALGLKQIDVLGFSLGGMIAQQLSLDHPRLVRRVMLLGTGPQGGEGMTFTELSPDEQANPEALLLAAFFSPTKTSQAAGRALLERLGSRTADRDQPAPAQARDAQLGALREWGKIPSSDRYANLANIKHRVLLVHGNHDIVVSPLNALILAQQLPNAQLIVYPDSGHGAQYQHADLFLKHATMFLNA